MQLQKRKKKKDVEKKKTIFSMILTIFVICFFAVPVGYTLGNLLVSANKTDEVYDIALDDVSQIMYAGKTPAEMSPIEVYLVANNILIGRDYYYITSEGEIDAQITSQTVNNVFIKDGQTYYQERLSKGIVSVANKVEYTEGGNVLFTEGKVGNNATVAWKGAPATYSKEYFISCFGMIPNEINSYVIASSTVIDSSSKQENNLFTFTLSLNPQTSTQNYRKQVEFFSGRSNSNPTFTKVEITFTVDSDFNFVSMSINETYTMKYIGVITVSSSKPVTSKFSYERPL